LMVADGGCYIVEEGLLRASHPPAYVRAAGEQVLALFFVAAFGSSLDVAAIQSESPEPLDFNHELQTVGATRVPLAALQDSHPSSAVCEHCAHLVSSKLAWHMPDGMLQAADFRHTLTSLPERLGLCMWRTCLRMPATACRLRCLSGRS